MKIYIAGLLSNMGSGDPASLSVKVIRQIKHPFLLESYYYLSQSGSMIREMQTLGVKLFLDSGAFSVFTRDAKINLREYASFIWKHRAHIDVASSLDVIGKGNEQANYDNFKQLEHWLKPEGLAVQPVHHVHDHDDWLRRYLDEGCDYIFLGGMVPESAATLRAWLDHVWHDYLTPAKVKVHGFGLTKLELMFRYPWHSVDSTSWLRTSRYGGVFMDFPQEDGSIWDFKIDFSQRSSSPWHFNNLSRLAQEKIVQRLEELEAERVKHPETEELFRWFGIRPGYYVEALSQVHGWRDHANVSYFARAQHRVPR